jgi:hypothetical protein
MNKKNYNKKLLNEEVNRFNSILENSFAFYTDENTDEENVSETDKLLLGNEISEEEEDNNSENELDIPDEDIEIPGEDEEGGEAGDEEGGFGDDAGNEEGGFGDDEGGDMEPEEEPLDDAVELDVTQLVQGSEEAKASADQANLKIDKLMGMVDNLEGQLAGMSKISSKIDSLENELEKRTPTPDEKLEMRSLDSAPFNMRLGDFWKDQEGRYDIMSEPKEKEYVLNKKEIDKDYSDDKLKDSFDNEYEEEEF